MKTILCYGDSLTYGANPVMGGPRHAYEDRWPTALETALQGKVRCIAEGLGGRTTVHDDWYADSDRNGARILPTLLSSHDPLDMVIIMLGTNDIKPFHGRTALEASWGMRRLVHIVRAHAASELEALGTAMGMTCEAEPDPHKALDRAVAEAAGRGGWMLVTGSLYLIGEMRPPILDMSQEQQHD